MTDDPFRAMIEAEFVVERTGWAAERVDRVSARLQPEVAPADRFETLVVWFEDHGAFTRDGKTLYFSRRLLERLADDDAAAFIVAHEIAHHRLGHIPRLSSRWSIARKIAWGVARELWITSAERERDADLLAIEMCLDAGYDLDRCLGALEHLEHVSLDYGDIGGAVGYEDHTVRSHPPVRARIAEVRAHAAQVRLGHRLSIDLARQRERIRRRKLAYAAAGSVAAATAVMLWRRGREPALAAIRMMFAV
jgi:predicted Zn-dependent protease